MSAIIPPTPGSTAAVPAGPPAAARVPAAPAASSASPTPPSPQAQAVATALPVLAARQGGLAPLMAELSQALAQGALPDQARGAAEALLAMRLSADSGPTAADIEQAFDQSGLFTETFAADGEPPPNLDSTLADLGQTLEAWLAAEPAGEDSAPAPSQTAPPPPYRDAPTAGQPPALPTLPPDASAALLARRLLQQTGAARARQSLLQIASLPDTADGPSWLFEIPFLTPQGTAIAQIQLKGDQNSRRRRSPSAPPPIWRAILSLELESIGPIHAQIAMAPDRTSVTLWAERASSAQDLRQDQRQLASSLSGAGVPADIAVHHGAPARAPPAPGRFLDQAT